LGPPWVSRCDGNYCRELLGRCHRDRRGCVVWLDTDLISGRFDLGLVVDHHHNPRVDDHHDHHDPRVDDHHRTRAIPVELDGWR